MVVCILQLAPLSTCVSARQPVSEHCPPATTTVAPTTTTVAPTTTTVTTDPCGGECTSFQCCIFDAGVPVHRCQLLSFPNQGMLALSGQEGLRTLLISRAMSEEGAFELLAGVTLPYRSAWGGVRINIITISISILLSYSSPSGPFITACMSVITILPVPLLLFLSGQLMTQRACRTLHAVSDENEILEIEVPG